MKEYRKIIIPATRLLWPKLVEHSKIGQPYVNVPKDEKYSATFLLHKEKHADVIVKINEVVEEFKEILKLKKFKYNILKCCDKELDDIYTGDEAGKAKRANREFKANHFAILASSQSDKQPTLRSGKGVELELPKDNNLFYHGCYVNTLITLATNDKPEYRNTLSKFLTYVCFAKDGDRLGGSDGDSIDFGDDTADLGMDEADMY